MSNSTKNTTPKERQLPITSIINFLNDQYSSSEFSEINNIKFKQLGKKKVDNKSNKKIIKVSKCPGVIDFMNTFTQNKIITKQKETKDGKITEEKQISMKELKQYIFDFDIRAVMDIIETYPKFCEIDEKTGESILTSHLLKNIDLPKYVPISVNDLFSIIDRYFTDELYTIKLINQIYPHAERKTNGKKTPIKTIYIQRVPHNVKDTLRLIAEDKSLEEIIDVIQESIKPDIVLPGKVAELLAKSKSVKESILKKEPFNYKKFFAKLAEQHDKYKLEIDEKKNTIKPEVKRLITKELHKYLRELSQVKYLYNIINEAIQYQDIDKSKLNDYYEKFIELHDKMNKFFKNAKYNRKSLKQFLKYFIDTLNFCFDIFNIPNETKKEENKKEINPRYDFINQFLKLVDTNKRIRLGKDYRKDITSLNTDEFIKKYEQDIEKITSKVPYDEQGHKKLVSFFYNLGKNSIQPEHGDRITKETYIALGLTIIKYIQREVYKEIYAHSRSNDIMIYLTA